jgi:hypothetical protein
VNVIIWFEVQGYEGMLADGLRPAPRRFDDEVGGKLCRRFEQRRKIPSRILANRKNVILFLDVQIRIAAGERICPKRTGINNIDMKA